MTKETEPQHECVEKTYYVVFEGTGEPGGNYKGVRTYRSFASKADFDNWRATSGNREKILTEGVSESQAIDLCMGQSISNIFRAAYRQAGGR